jgi:hypothetical protein
MWRRIFSWQQCAAQEEKEEKEMTKKEQRAQTKGIERTC